MNVLQKMTADFHRASDGPVGDRPGLRATELFLNMIKEESQEFVESLEAGDLVGAAHEAGDILYVIFGWFVAAGIDAQKVVDEIHRTNFLKLGGPVRADGKRLRPPGWTPPDILGIVDDAMNACTLCHGTRRMLDDDGYVVECVCFDGRISPRPGSCRGCGRPAGKLPGKRCTHIDFHEIEAQSRISP